MRLTLRTLLAYLDDTLEPSQAKVIGQKVAESDAAQELIARLKQVTRRRRLTTPPATGPGAKIDANTIAEYLDNVLPSEQLAAVEETCLASDVHLAEVAACHQILTLVLGQPALVPPVARQRMYGLVQGREAIPYRKPPAETLPARPDEDAALSAADDTDDTLLGLPLFRPGGPGKWLIPVAALVLLAASALALRMALPPRAPLVAHAEAPPQDVQVAVVPPPQDVRPEPAGKVEPPAKPEARPEGKGEERPEGSMKGGAGVGLPAVGAEARPAPEKVAVVPPPAAPAAEAVAPPASKERRELGRYVAQAPGTPSVLMQKTPGKDQWERVRPASSVSSTDTLVSLPGYRSDLRLNSNVSLQLWGDLPELSRMRIYESGVVLYDNPEVDLDFRLERGRVALSSRKETGPARVLLRFHNEAWEITLQDRSTEVVLVLFGLHQPGSGFRRDPRNEGWLAGLGLFVFAGQATVRVRGHEFAVKGPAELIWDSQSPAEPAPPQAMKTLPEWWTNKMGQDTREAKAARTALEELSKQLAGAAIDVVLTGNLRDPESMTRILAVRCLAAVDDLPRLLDALNNERFVDVRLVAIEALRHWIGLRPDNDQKLYQALREKKYPEAQAEIVMSLLHDYSPEQTAQPATYEALIAYLVNDRLPIRELAYWHLMRLVPEGPKKIGYDPAQSTPEQRDASYRAWKQLIPDGKLPPNLPGKQ